ncbi:MAG: response regulator, partial [Spirochaeta sp.]|nr:response regulator [Spirochaeta sp.]
MAQYSDRMSARIEALSAKFAVQLPDKLDLIHETYSAVFARVSGERVEAALDTTSEGSSKNWSKASAGTRRLVAHLRNEVVQPSFDAAYTALLAAVGPHVREHKPYHEGDARPLSDTAAKKTVSGAHNTYSEASSGSESTLQTERATAHDDTGTLLPVGPEDHPHEQDADSFIVYLLDDTPPLIPDLEEQLGFFRMPVYKITSLAELNFSAVAVGLRPEIKDKIILCDFALLDKMPGLEEHLQKLTNGPGFRCVVVFVSDRDDFTTRLRAVRAGGAAFFSPPVDISVVIDRVDGLRGAGTTEPYHILIIDDDPEQVSHTALILQQAGMITSVVSDPSQVVAVMIESRPELILMDLYMPDCDGFELTRIIRQQDSFVAVPIVFISVESDREKQLGAIAAGADDFLVKPVKPEHLVKAVSLRAERTRSMRYFMERDSLTGLLNHSNLKGSLGLELQRA